MHETLTGVCNILATGFIIAVDHHLPVGTWVVFAFSLAVGFSGKVCFRVAFVFSLAVGFSRRKEVLFMMWGFSPFCFVAGLKSLKKRGGCPSRQLKLTVTEERIPQKFRFIARGTKGVTPLWLPSDSGWLSVSALPSASGDG